MSDYQPIIDATPINHSRERRAGGARGSSARQSSQSPFWSAPSSRYSSTGTDTTPPFGIPYAQSDRAAGSKSGGSVIGGLAQIAAGAGLVLIGIPMLILPGPGLLSIAGGFMLAANGVRKIFG